MEVRETKRKKIFEPESPNSETLSETGTDIYQNSESPIIMVLYIVHITKTEKSETSKM